MLISDAYRALNHELHQRGNYGVSGGKWAGMVRDLAKGFGCRTVLDYGCGQCTLRAALGEVPFELREYDPALPDKAGMPEKAELVVCCDVLEHVEPDCLYSVLDHLRDLSRKATFLVIATRPAAKFLADGRNAHLIVEKVSWWLPKLENRWKLRGF